MRRGAGVLVTGGVLLLSACGGTGPSSPTPFEPQSTAEPTAGVRALHDPNNAPTLILRTQPAWIAGDPLPVVTTREGAPVHFNLCRSEDPDMVTDAQPTAGEGDSLNWQFHFGDDASEPFLADGTFNAHFAHFCRTDHAFEAGTYTVTVSVTDKHLEDQTRGEVSAAARVTRQVRVVSLPEPDPIAPLCVPVAGSLSGTEPTYTRAFCPTGAPPCSPSGTGVGVSYDQIFCSFPGGPATVDLMGDNVDTFLFLYAGSFSPGSPLANIVAANDDFGSQSRSLISGTFPAGNYVLVVTSFAPGQTYNYTLTTTFP